MNVLECSSLNSRLPLFFARWVKETQIPHGTMREIFQCCLLRDSNRAWRFWMCSFFLPCLVARAETHPLKKLLVWCLRVSFCRSALFNECEQKLSADTNTWISIQKLEKILHPMKRRWPGMQRLWDLHQIWFIRAFSSHSFFQDWLVNSIADLCFCSVTSLLHCFGLIFILCILAVIMPNRHAGYVATGEGHELDLK